MKVMLKKRKEKKMMIQIFPYIIKRLKKKIFWIHSPNYRKSKKFDFKKKKK